MPKEVYLNTVRRGDVLASNTGRDIRILVLEDGGPLDYVNRLTIYGLQEGDSQPRMWNMWITSRQRLHGWRKVRRSSKETRAWVDEVMQTLGNRGTL